MKMSDNDMFSLLNHTNRALDAYPIFVIEH